jgi:prephenate dehydrogenase
MREPCFRNPLVVGYKGEIGSFILQGLLRTMPKASNIWCFDINETEKEKIDRIKKSDVIFLCVPMQDTPKWMMKYYKFIKGKTIIEQTSLKGCIYNQKKFNFVKECDGPTLMSMHILFRPSVTPNKEDRKVILINQEVWQFGFSGLYKSIEEITNSEIVYIKDWKTHDMLMAFQQALVHRVLLTLDRTLLGIGGQTYIGKKLKELTYRIRSGDPTLYQLIQKNRYLPEVMKSFNKNLKNFKITKEVGGD